MGIHLREHRVEYPAHLSMRPFLMLGGVSNGVLIIQVGDYGRLYVYH